MICLQTLRGKNSSAHPHGRPERQRGGVLTEDPTVPSPAQARPVLAGSARGGRREPEARLAGLAGRAVPQRPAHTARPARPFGLGPLPPWGVEMRGRRCPHLPASSPFSARSSCFASFSTVRARERSLLKKSRDTSIARGAERDGSGNTARPRLRRAALWRDPGARRRFRTGAYALPVGAASPREKCRRQLSREVLQPSCCPPRDCGRRVRGSARRPPRPFLEPTPAWKRCVLGAVGRWCGEAARLHGARSRGWVRGWRGSSVPARRCFSLYVAGGCHHGDLSWKLSDSEPKGTGINTGVFFLLLIFFPP